MKMIFRFSYHFLIIIGRLQAVLLSLVFAHHGHITKEEAKEISGMADHEFDKAYDKAANIADNVMQHEGEKMDKFLEHFAE